jgi:tRNA 2-thiouridine synthesizing protein A
VSPAPDHVSPLEVDARGLRCPLPVIRLAEAARSAPTGSWIVVLASDPATRYDIPAWCRMRGHELVEIAEVPEIRTVPETPTVTETPTVPGSSTRRGAAAEGEQPGYLRFLVRTLPQRSKTTGTGSGSARSSRAR